MSTFVLVHGAWHGAWCWYKVVPILEQRGHDVVAVDLPAHGTDTTPAGTVTLTDYVGTVRETIDEQEGPVTLVGHSLGGITITETAEHRPDAIDTLVYLSAFLLPDGDAAVAYAERDEDSVVTRNLVADEDEGIATIPREAVDDAFYADCDDRDRVLAHSLIREEPLAPLTTAVSTSDENFGRVRRVYVGCEEDRAISPWIQTEMQEEVGVDASTTLETSHSPFFSAPTATVDAIESLAEGE